MNSQNRMNAGAEYVLYRIWATLQEREGIHAESLLTCVGALAGYACQASARQSNARSGSANFSGDALNRPLVASPLSVWSLVRRAVQKADGPLPDFEGISAHVTRTFGTSAFGVPRVPDEHRPRRLPIVYLTQLWPQILPIAQRFCRRPSQLPVLFGIALQRAIEHTTERLNPTLAASIAMECALAMSMVTLPSAISDLFQTPGIAPDITVTAKPAIPQPLPEIRATKKKRRPAIDRIEIPPFAARMRSAKGIATIMSVAIVSIVTFTWKVGDTDAATTTARVERGLNIPALQVRANTVETPPLTEAQFPEAPITPQIAQEIAPTQSEPLPEDIPQPAEELALPAAPAPDVSEGIITDDGQSA